MFENKIIDGVHATRYIASWIRSGGSLERRHGTGEFIEWLNTLGLAKEDIRIIRHLAENGRMELEHSVEKFLANK